MSSIIAGSNSSEQIFDGQRKDFVVMRKNTFSFSDNYAYKDSDGNDAEYDFTGCIGMMSIKKRKSDKTVVRLVSVAFDTTDTSLYTVSVPANEMDMNAGKYFYDLVIYDADGNIVTKLYGVFHVLQNVTEFDVSSRRNENFITKFYSALKHEYSRAYNTAMVFKNIITYVLMPSYTFKTVFSTSISSENVFTFIHERGISTSSVFSTFFSNTITVITTILYKPQSYFYTKITYTII